MTRMLVHCAVLALSLLPFAAAAEPIKLSLAFFSSDRSTSYLAALKPFVDAVNAEAKGVIAIDVKFSGALGKDPAQQLQLVLDGKADIAYVIPGYRPDRFADNAVIELPGLFQDMREATLVFTRLIAANALKDYEGFVVIGAFASELASIHCRMPVASLDDMKGKRIRANNSTGAAALEKLGAVPALMPVNHIAEGISSSRIDCASLPLAPLFEFGIARVAAYHFLLRTAPAPLVVLMSRQRFESLPVQAQAIIRKFSGEWPAVRFIEARAVIEAEVMERLKSDPKRQIFLPSQSDLARAQNVFKSVAETWAAASPHNRELLDMAKAEIVKLRSIR